MEYTGLDVIKDDLNQLESFIIENVRSPQVLISSAVDDLIQAGGKRIRPALTILCGRAVGHKINRLIPIAASMEIIHMATLVHDDIIDDSALRRGQPTVQSKYGKDVAVFTGDFLFSEAFKIISKYADSQSLKGFAHAVKRICEGEIEQYESRHSTDVSLLKYLRRIKRKTGMLMALSCMSGAAAKKADSKLVRSMGSYGMYLGLAFQITDDVLDFTGDMKVVGKPVGNDTRQGVFTLPLIYAMSHSKDRDKLYRLLGDDLGEKDLNTVVNIVRDAGGIEYSRALAKRYVYKGIKHIEPLKDSIYKRALKELIISLNERDY